MIAGKVPRGQPEIRLARIRMTSERAAMGRSMKINNCAESVRSSTKAAPFARSIGRLATFFLSWPELLLSTARSGLAQDSFSRTLENESLILRPLKAMLQGVLVCRTVVPILSLLKCL